MDRKQIEEKLKEKNLSYILQLKYNQENYVQALKNLDYIYFKINEDDIEEVTNTNILKYFKEIYEIKPSTIIY